MTDKLSNGQVSLRKYLVDLFDEKINVLRQRLEQMDTALIEAKVQMESRMNGFPDQFIRKGDADVAIVEVKLRMDMLANTVGKFDAMQIVPRPEYLIQHKSLEDKLGAAQTDIAEKTELARSAIVDKTDAIKSEFSLRLEAVDAKVQAGERSISNINGKIVGTGAAVGAILAVIQIMIHVFWTK